MPSQWVSEGHLKLGFRCALDVGASRRARYAFTLSPLLAKMAVLPLATLGALALPVTAQAASQGAGMVATAVEAYAATQTECDYRPEVGGVLKQLENFFSDQAGDEWEPLRAEARRQLVVATNVEALRGGAGDSGSLSLQCRVYGSTIGQALLLSIAVVKPDQAVLAEADRLMNGGARPRSGAAVQASQAGATQIPQSSSSYRPSVTGTNMGPGYRSTYGRPAGASTPQTAMVTPKLTPGTPPARLAYGGRDGEKVDITSVSGLDTEHAMIGIHQTRANAVAACISVEKSASPQCVSSMLAMPFRNAVYANCKTGVIVDFRGRKYRFEGPTPPQSEEGGGAKYRIEDLTSNEILADTTADGYRNIMHLYQDLCPVTAPADL